MPRHDGPSDPYGCATPSCWAMFTEILARDYSQYQHLPEHRLVVDAYMVQHPNFATAAGRRSVVIHLTGIYAAVVCHMPFVRIGHMLGEIFPNKEDAPVLAQPLSNGQFNVGDIYVAAGLKDHSKLAWEWGISIWQAWRIHEETLLSCLPGKVRVELSKAWPNQLAGPTPTSVTAPARQEPRRP